MDADQGLDCFDHPLGVANKETVDPFRRQVLDHAGEQARERLALFSIRLGTRNKAKLSNVSPLPCD